jgi:aminoglycoside/choline kinase family phosphotransferase
MSSETSDNRIAALKFWLQNELRLEILDFQHASEDASFRRYFRVFHSNGQHIAMDAPPATENIRAFVDIALLLKQAGIHSPKIVAQNLSNGFLLLEDLGDRTFFDLVSGHSAEQLYQSALNCLFKLQSRLLTPHLPLPIYDQALLEKELGIFYQWFVEKHCGLSMPLALQQSLNKLLIDSALEQPQVFVHRDFHSRNLMIVEDNSPAVIDFQDAVKGPVTYDVVSLLRDCYIQWPEEMVEDWLNQYYQRLLSAGLITAPWIAFKRWFDLMGLQRHLKAIGIFARLNYRDNKPGYLADIPRTLSYISQVCQAYPALNEFNQFLVQQILPHYPEP